MSLDVYLTVTGEPSPVREVIFVCEDGSTHEMSLAEWKDRYPTVEPMTVKKTDEVYSRNITHNLGKMADVAGIYQHLWRPDKIGIAKAAELIEPLEAGLKWLQADPEIFKVYNPNNGWGTYEGLVDFVSEYLQACRDNPGADVRVSR